MIRLYGAPRNVPLVGRNGRKAPVWRLVANRRKRAQADQARTALFNLAENAWRSEIERLRKLLKEQK